MLITPHPSSEVVSCAALGLPGIPPKGGCPTLPPPGGCYTTERDPSRAHTWGRVPPDRGLSPTESHEDFLDFGVYPKLVPPDLSKKVQFSRIEFRWDFIPGQDHI